MSRFRTFHVAPPDPGGSATFVNEMKEDPYYHTGFILQKRDAQRSIVFTKAPYG